MGTCAFSWEHILLILLILDSILKSFISRQEFAFFFNTLPAGTGKLNYKYFSWLSLSCKTDMRMYVALTHDTLSDKNLSLRQCLNLTA